MKLVSYLKEGNEQVGFYVDGLVYDADHVHPELPGSMNVNSPVHIVFNLFNQSNCL